jgi:hypothetical protein
VCVYFFVSSNLKKMQGLHKDTKTKLLIEFIFFPSEHKVEFNKCYHSITVTFHVFASVLKVFSIRVL